MYGKSIKSSYCLIRSVNCYLQYPHCEGLGIQSKMILNYLIMGGGGHHKLCIMSTQSTGNSASGICRLYMSTHMK